ncbi:arylsulfatase [Agromyces aerolatus]|uniref:arylsulfatase n=1 Tax=Agromyces sp. LY-1074 TaxID=3074080 RepID=UPI00285EF298|nr:MULTISPECIES: arylsulfatase [unclassified Agromyces]MDR5701669.1 arylsulfatase [Agromyces sp. LY-1074]MDR5707891.1 arylsulfatase [Agromyces sp. LY-1358]
MTGPNRDALPIHRVDANPRHLFDANEGEWPFTTPLAVEPPEGAPNIVLVVLDDMGFGSSSAFGGPCEMPTAERLANGGLRFSRFHVNAICSPTRQSLLTGRNSHAVGMGATTELGTSAPGYTSIRPTTAATIAQILVENGYSTGAFGKMHQTPQWEVSTAGPFDRWPTGEGFERFYGFIGPEMNHWDPLLFDGTTPVEPARHAEGEYHLSEDLADRAIDWLTDLSVLTPEKPFFMYLPMAACHGPLHVGREWQEAQRGRFDHGWDRQREITLERQKAIGVIPDDAELAPKPPGIVEWESLSEEEQRASTAFMETYAAVAAHVDAQIGRVVDALEALGRLDDTLVLYLLGDNGASAEGGLHGTLNVERSYSGIEDSPSFLAEHLDELGGPLSYPLHPSGWAVAMSTPYQWTKQIASHFGGTRDGLIAHWPKGIAARGEVRDQWHHVIDIAPTILELAGLPAPRSVNGVQQEAMDGVSMAYAFGAQDAPSRRTTQYFEALGNRAIYDDGWIASIKHRTPWEQVGTTLVPFDEEEWELYDLRNDWTQSRNIAAEHPEKVAYLTKLFFAEAVRNKVFPMDDRATERYSPDLAGRRELLGGRSAFTFHASTRRLGEEIAPNVKNRDHVVRADLEVFEDGPDGVLLAQGGRFGGWVFHLIDGRPAYSYNRFDLERSRAMGPDRLRPGAHVVSFESRYLGPELGGAAHVRMFVDGDEVAELALERTTPFLFSSHETMDVGIDLGTPVVEDYATPWGELERCGIRKVDVQVGAGYLDPEAHARRVIAHQ